MPIKLEKHLQPLAPWFAKYRRDCWKPVVEKGDGPATAAKFAGTPYLAEGEAWPACGHCKGPMRLFVQLDLDALPDGAGPFGHGLLQAFICIKEDCVYGAGEGDPFSECQLLRIVKPTKPGAKVEIPAFKGDLRRGPFPPKRIVGWTRADDYPALPEVEVLGLKLDKDDVLRCPALKFKVPSDIDEFCDLDANVGREKLGGWPGWSNVNVDYPDCPKCGTRMDRTIFQIGHGGHIPFMFGDGGQGNIVQCPRHKAVLAYPWTCG